MNATDIHKLLLDEFGDQKITGANLESIDPWVEVAPDAIVEVSRFVKQDERLQMQHLNDLTAVDYFEPDPKKQKKFEHEPHLQVVYHLSSFTLKHRIVLKVKLPRWKNDDTKELPEIASVSAVWGIADWHERECYDLCGVHFTDHPNLRRILCPEDWEGHALRKDYDMPLEYHGIRGK